MFSDWKFKNWRGIERWKGLQDTWCGIFMGNALKVKTRNIVCFNGIPLP